MIRTTMVALAALPWLAACASAPTALAIKTVTVDLPTPIACVPRDYAPPPASPVTRQALLAAPDAAARYQLLAEFWTAETPVLALQAGVIAACQAAQSRSMAVAGDPYGRR